jgi:O-antigen/teichoic acid export membrane protein
MLGPEGYGEFSSIISVLGVIFVAFNFLGTVIIKFISSAKDEEIPVLTGWFIRRIKFVAIFLSVLVFFASFSIAGFLHTDKNVTMILAPITFFAYLAFAYRSIAQGVLNFKVVVFSINLDMLIRFLLGILLIQAGYSVFGAVLGIMVSELVAFLYLYKTSGNYPKSSRKMKPSIGKKMLKYALLVFIATLATNSMFSTDVILVKHFFDSHEAGIYASLSSLGRIIFYGTGPISAVMFPIISRKYAKGESHKLIFNLSVLLTTGMSLGIVLVYYFFPELSIKILFGESFIDGSIYLFKFGILMSIYALGSLILSVLLSIDKIQAAYIPLAAAIAQALGIIAWHKNIDQVINISLVSSLFFLIAIFSFYRYYSSYEKPPVS